MRYNCYMPEVASTPHYDVAEQSDHVEVRGVSRNDVLEALRLLDTLRDLQATQVRDKRGDLVRALMTSNISLTPPASVAQAQRLATHRSRCPAGHPTSAEAPDVADRTDPAGKPESRSDRCA